MFFTTILTTTLLLQIQAFVNFEDKEHIKYFKSLSPVVYKNHATQDNNLTYSKVPTKMIKIDKKSI